MCGTPFHITNVDYLVACKGHLHNGLDEVPRKDALARIVRAVLVSKAGSTRRVHLLFEDGCVVTISHAFLSSWGRGEPRDFQKDRFVELLSRVLRDARLIPAKDKHPAPQGCSVSCPQCQHHFRQGSVSARTLTEQLYPIVSEAIGGVFLLEEEGAPLFHGAPTKVGPAARNKSLPLLFMIGGVRDALPCEVKAVREICERKNIKFSSISIGRRSELTSKCIKVVEALDAAGRLADSLSQCTSTCTTSGEKPFQRQQCAQHQVEDIQPLHIIVQVDELKATPVLAARIVDVFFRSRTKCICAKLSLLDADGKVLTIKWTHVNELLLREQKKVLSEDFEKVAEEIFETAVGSEACTSLDRVIARERSSERRKGRELLVLSSPSTSEHILDFPLPHEAAFTDTIDKNSDAVMVIFSDKEVQGATVRGSLGSDLALAPAWASVVHGEGLLAPAIRAKRDDLSKPIVSLNPQPTLTLNERGPTFRVGKIKVLINEETQEKSDGNQEQPVKRTFAEIMKERAEKKRPAAEAQVKMLSECNQRELVEEEANKMKLCEEDIQREPAAKESPNEKLPKQQHMLHESENVTQNAQLMILCTNTEVEKEFAEAQQENELAEEKRDGNQVQPVKRTFAEIMKEQAEETRPAAEAQVKMLSECNQQELVKEEANKMKLCEEEIQREPAAKESPNEKLPKHHQLLHESENGTQNAQLMILCTNTEVEKEFAEAQQEKGRPEEQSDGKEDDFEQEKMARSAKEENIKMAETKDAKETKGDLERDNFKMTETNAVNDDIYEIVETQRKKRDNDDFEITRGIERDNFEIAQTNVVNDDIYEIAETQRKEKHKDDFEMEKAIVKTKGDKCEMTATEAEATKDDFELEKSNNEPKEKTRRRKQEQPVKRTFAEIMKEQVEEKRLAAEAQVKMLSECSQRELVEEEANKMNLCEEEIQREPAAKESPNEKFTNEQQLLHESENGTQNAQLTILCTNTEVEKEFFEAQQENELAEEKHDGNQEQPVKRTFAEIMKEQAEEKRPAAEAQVKMLSECNQRELVEEEANEMKLCEEEIQREPAEKESSNEKIPKQQQLLHESENAQLMILCTKTKVEKEVAEAQQENELAEEIAESQDVKAAAQNQKLFKETAWNKASDGRQERQTQMTFAEIMKEQLAERPRLGGAKAQKQNPAKEDPQKKGLSGGAMAA